jgi:TPR repeat protein
MFFRRRRRGIGLTGILVILALLYFTGAGKWLWSGALQAEGKCYNLMGQMGTTAGTPLCGGIGSLVRTLDSATSDIGGKAQMAVDYVKGLFADHNLDSVVGRISVPRSLQNLGSPRADLGRMMGYGPGNMTTGSSAADKLRNAIDSFQIGSELMQGSENSVRNAVPWLQRGAETPGYGLLSQLSLGDIYRQGRGDVAANPQEAVTYYSSAYRSIDLLQANNSPAAQQLLATLPGSPEAVKQQLVQAINQMKPR